MKRGGMYRSRELPEEPPVNLTPLIDVVFVVLIMFIVIAPLMDMDQVQLAGGPANPRETKTIKDNSPVNIHVHHDNTIWLNKQLVTVDALQPLLRDIKTKHPQATPVVFHDRRAIFGTYQAIKNALEGAGYEQMEIVLNPS